MSYRKTKDKRFVYAHNMFKSNVCVYLRLQASEIPTKLWLSVFFVRLFCLSAPSASATKKKEASEIQEKAKAIFFYRYFLLANLFAYILVTCYIGTFRCI